MIKNLLFGLSLCLAYAVTGQRAQDWITLGDRAIEDNDPYGALRYYENAMELDSSKAEIQFKYAEALRHNHYYNKSAYYYYKVYRKEQGRIYPLSGYWLAMMQKQSGNYKEAKQTFRRVRDQFEDTPDSYYYRKAVQEMRSCDFAELWQSDDGDASEIKPVNGVVSTESSEFDGKFFADGRLLFTALRGEYDDEGRLLSEDYQAQLYVSDPSFSSLKEFTPFPEKPIGFGASEDSSYIAMVISSEAGNKILLKKGNTTITTIPATAKDSSWYSHPTFGEIKGEKILLFASDREGGFGREDIWYIYLDRPEDIINAGKLVNSPGSEITPFFRWEEKELYFASDWHYGLGGFDIFSAAFVDDEFGIPGNLKPPFNTRFNDLYYSFSEPSLKGSITSNRVGAGDSPHMGCCNDLFYFQETRGKEEPLITSLEDLNKYLPVTLYFHNDEPDPRTRDTTTNQNYIDTYYKYIELIPEYEREYSKGLTEDRSDLAEERIDRFFIEEVDKGIGDLELFTSLLSEELKKGSRVELTVRGFASPLAETDYNVNLTSRRISSLVNYLSEYKGGELLPYLRNNAENGGFLRVIKIPFGEYVANEVISDNPNESNAIYSIGAALERKIEIVSVQQSARDSALVQLNFNTEIANLGRVTRSDTLEYQFNFTASENCDIDSVYTESSALEITGFLKIENTGFIKVRLTPADLEGKQRQRIYVLGNFPERKKELNITFDVNGQ